METAFIHLGILPNQLLKLTYREFRALLRAAKKLRIQKVQDNRSLAWHTAVFNAQAKVKDALPSHEKAIIVEVDDTPQTDEQLFAIFSTLQATLPEGTITMTID